MKYLALGGSGFLGSEIVEFLAQENDVVIADFNLNPRFANKDNIQFIQFDFLKDEICASILDGVDVVIHLISTLLPGDGTAHLPSAIMDNVIPSINLLEEVVKHKEIQVLFISSGGTIYGEGGLLPSNEDDSKHAYCSYALVKAFIESTLELYRHQHQLKYKIVRISNPYGLTQRSGRMQGLIPIFVERIIKDEEIVIWGDGHNIRDYIYIDDVVRAIDAVLSYDGEERVFNIGSGEGHSIHEIICQIQKALGDGKVPQIQYAPQRKCDLKKNILDISRITACTKWVPQISLQEGIARIVRAYQS